MVVDRAQTRASACGNPDGGTYLDAAMAERL
jgi:hypothetical protein